MLEFTAIEEGSVILVKAFAVPAKEGRIRQSREQQRRSNCKFLTFNCQSSLSNREGGGGGGVWGGGRKAALHSGIMTRYSPRCTEHRGLAAILETFPRFKLSKRAGVPQGASFFGQLHCQRRKC